MQLIEDAWSSLDSAGRIAVIIGVVVLLGLAMWLGLDLSWVPKLLGVG